MCKELEINDIISQEPEVSRASWKNTVKKAIKRRNESELKDRIQNYSKLTDLQSETCCKRQKYLSSMTMAEARIKFRLRTFTFPCKMNQVNDPRHRAELWRCDSCSSLLDPDSQNNIDSQSHILWCPAYKKLREGKSLNSDKDMINYFRQVMLIRSKLKLTK